MGIGIAARKILFLTCNTECPQFAVASGDEVRKIGTLTLNPKP